MDPTTTFCPNRNCPARGQTGQGNIGIHSRKEQRFICHACDKTFSATKGTVFYPELFMRAKRVHGIHSMRSYNRTIHHHHLRSEPT
jgi:transposase-like protein